MAIHPLLEDRGFTPFHAAQIAEKARWAAQAFSTFDHASVLKIADAVATAAHKNARRHAEMVVRETGYGIADHKTLKNEACSKGILARYRGEDFTGVRLAAEAKIVEIAKPAGTVFVALPATNPIAALSAAAILCLLTRNAVIFSPHPAARKSTVEAARHVAKIAEEAGAPDGTIQVIDAPSQAINETLAKSANVTITAEGDGNVPVYVDRSANIPRAARAIAESKSFDSGIGFGNESAIIADAAIADRLRDELAQNGCHICSETERGKLESLLFPLAKFDSNWTGKSAVAIAAKAGIKVPSKTRLLVVPLDRVGDDYPLSREKPCPVLGFYVAANRDSAMSASRAMIRGEGAGTSAAIHAEDAGTVLRFGAEMDVTRVFVNAGMSENSAGLPTHIAPFDLTPDRLVRRVAMAWSKDSAVKLPSFAGVDLPRPPVMGRSPHGEVDYDFGNPPPAQSRKPAARSKAKTRA
jgi:acetaldehyde dehydrogenase / alcohol dehydrogenase